MLEWNEIRGYDNRIVYNKQVGVNLPELREEILFIRPNDEKVCVGYFAPFSFFGRVQMWSIDGDEGELTDGVKWARFNRP